MFGEQFSYRGIRLAFDRRFFDRYDITILTYLADRFTFRAGFYFDEYFGQRISFDYQPGLLQASSTTFCRPLSFPNIWSKVSPFIVPFGK